MIFGSDSNACAPSAFVLTGTTRRSTTLRSLLAQISSTTSKFFKSFVKTEATANCFESSTPFSHATLRMNSSGIPSKSPLPSPVFPSAATAPRCIIRSSAVIASFKTLRDGLLSMFATRPNPQLSLNDLNKS